MPVRFHHHPDYILDVGIRNLRLKEVAHAVDKNGARPRPFERLGNLFGNEAKVETLLVGVPFNAAKSLGERLGIAVFATRTDLRAAPKRIPSCVRPLDFRVITHRASLLSRLWILFIVAIDSLE